MATTGIFLTLSNHGIYYYQRWIPTPLQSNKSIFRVSLRTSDKMTAKRLSRVLSVKFDQLALDYFENPEDFARAMELLHQSAKTWNENPYFPDYEAAFLSRIQGYDEYILSKGERFQESIQKDFNKLQDEVKMLQEILRNGNFGGGTENQDSLIQKIVDEVYPPIPDALNPTLKDALEAFNRDKKTNPRVPWLFIRYALDCGAKRVQDLDTGIVNGFIVFFIYTLSGCRYDQKSIKDLIIKSCEIKTLADKEEPFPADYKQLSAKSLLDRFGTVRVMFVYFSEKHPDAFNDKLITSIGAHNIEVTIRDKKKRPPYTDDELNRIFNHEEYAIYGKVNTSFVYWGPLIGLFSGARLGEIAQLERHDIYKDPATGIWVIDVKFFDPLSEEDGKGAKEQTSARIFPIHDKLMELGFLEYINKFENGRIFPDEPRKYDEKNKEYKFHNASMRFRTYLKHVDVKPAHDMEQKSFHNFRHTVRTRLKELKYDKKKTLRFDSGLIDSIIGHASKDRSTGETDYSHTDLIVAKKMALDLLQYDFIDFNKLIDWDKCKFWRKQFRK